MRKRKRKHYFLVQEISTSSSSNVRRKRTTRRSTTPMGEPMKRKRTKRRSTTPMGEPMKEVSMDVPLPGYLDMLNLVNNGSGTSINRNFKDMPFWDKFAKNFLAS